MRFKATYTLNANLKYTYNTIIYINCVIFHVYIIILNNCLCFFLGYTDILLIPAGATNIRVREIQPSNNYLGNLQF